MPVIVSFTIFICCYLLPHCLHFCVSVYLPLSLSLSLCCSYYYICSIGFPSHNFSYSLAHYLTLSLSSFLPSFLPLFLEVSLPLIHTFSVLFTYLSFFPSIESLLLHAAATAAHMSHGIQQDQRLGPDGFILGTAEGAESGTVGTFTDSNTSY